jgi:hypothetical protein
LTSGTYPGQAHFQRSVKLTSCYREVDFRLPAHQPVIGHAHFLLAGKLTSGYLNNLSPVKFTSCYKEVDFRPLFSNQPPVKLTLSFRFRSLTAFGQPAQSFRSSQLVTTKKD